MRVGPGHNGGGLQGVTCRYYLERIFACSPKTKHSSLFFLFFSSKLGSVVCAYTPPVRSRVARGRKEVSGRRGGCRRGGGGGLLGCRAPHAGPRILAVLLLPSLRILPRPPPSLRILPRHRSNATIQRHVHYHRCRNGAIWTSKSCSNLRIFSAD